MQKNNRIQWKKVLFLLFAAVLVSLCVLTEYGRETVVKVACAVGMEEPIEKVASISKGRYVYDTLTAEQQLVYDEMLIAILNHKERVRLSSLDKSEVQRCYEAICADYGEIFWVERCAYSERLLLNVPYALSFLITYSYTAEEVQAYQAQMQPTIDAYLEELRACESDYEKTETVYRRLIQEVSYEQDAPNNQNILSVFLGGKTVCQGYACAAQYLLQQVGVPCAIVTGTANDMPHAWNLVELDGEYYYLDVTWGSSGYQTVSDTARAVSYGYLDITTDELLRTHEPEVQFALPECSSTAANYYQKKHLFFDTWDMERVGERLGRAYEKGKKQISVKFALRAQLEQAIDYLIAQQHLADYCEGLTQFYYIQDVDLYVLTFGF